MKIGTRMTDIQPEYLDLVEPTDPLLNTVAEVVPHDEISSHFIQGTINRMLELSAGKGESKHDSRQMVGLAAMQLGINKRIITIDVTADGSKKDQHLQVFINPKITHHSNESVPGREGCWSCGNICGNVERSKEVTIEGLDREGQPIKFELTDFVARIAQHETDHLEGSRFPDRIPADRPERLHWVEPAEFDSYRQNWMHWPNLCPRERWEEMKQGITS
jgi:peptide deformylase